MVVFHVYCTNNGKYGVEVTEDDVVADRVDNLFSCELDAVKFALLCTSLQLSPIHLKDVAEDVFLENNLNKTQH